MSVTIRRYVYTAKIKAMSLPGGSIYRWTGRIAREMEALAVATAPIAVQDWGPGHVPGRLKASHQSSVSVGALGPVATIANTAPYARFVHEGTRAIITPTTWPYMKFTINGRTYRRQTVRGQVGRPWLDRAKDVVVRRHMT